MTGVTRPSTMASRFAASANNAGDAPGTEVLETGHFGNQLSPLLLEIGKGLRQGGLLVI